MAIFEGEEQARKCEACSMKYKLGGRRIRIEFYREKKREESKKPQESCWFCLDNPQVEKHLVLDIGAEMYLAMPKGPINEAHSLLISKNQ